MTRTVTRTLLMSIVVAVLLAGCGSATPGAAAVVGDRRISVSDVQSATVDAQKWVGNGSQISQTQVLYMLAIAPFFQEVATRYGAGASPEEARAALLTRVPDPSEAAVTVMRVNISITQLAEQLGQARTAEAMTEVTGRLTEEGFSVNPRFGDFDPTTGRINPLTPNWLPGPQPAPAPAR